MQKKIYFTIISSILICFNVLSQINEEKEVFLNKISTSEEKVYNNNFVQQKAIFIGGDSGLFKFYKKKSILKIKDFEVPDKSTYFNIYIDETGKVYDFKIVKSINKNYDKEIERLIHLMPKWKPAINNNKSVKVVLLDYITFQ